MLESKKQTQMINALKAKGCYVVKVITATKAGVHDIIVCYKGQFISIEVKRPDGKGVTSDLQLINRRDILAAGGKVIIATTVKEVIAMLDKLHSCDDKS